MLVKYMNRKLIFTIINIAFLNACALNMCLRESCTNPQWSDGRNSNTTQWPGYLAVLQHKRLVCPFDLHSGIKRIGRHL